MKGKILGLFLLILGCILTGVTGAQHLDTIIYFPDTMGYCYYPNAIFVNPLTERVYVSSNGMLVFDPANRTKDRYFRGSYTGGLFCSKVNKIYLSGEKELVVVDANQDQILRRIPVEFSPGIMAFSGISNKLYVGEQEGNLLYAFDAVTDTFVAMVELEDVPIWLEWDSITNRVLIGEEDMVEALDCATDSIVGTCSLYGMVDYVLNPTARKLYAANYYDTVKVLNADSLTVIKEVQLTPNLYSLAYNPVLNRVYCGSFSYIGVIDCADDTIRAIIPLESSENLVSSTVSGKVYAIQDYPDYAVQVIDSSNSVVATIILPATPEVSVFTPTRNELYCGLRTDRIAIVDCSTDTLKGYMEYPQYIIRGMVFNSIGNKLYLFFPERDTVLVLDRECRPVAAINIPMVEIRLFPVLNPGLNRLYLADSGRIWVIDCNADTLIGERRLEGLRYAFTALLVQPLAKLYVCPRYSPYQVYVYDCLRDTVTGFIPVQSTVGSAVYHPWSNRIYLSVYTDSSLWIIDPTGDTVVQKLMAGRRYRGNRLFAHPNNGRVYHSINTGTERLYTIDVRSNTVTDSVEISDDADTIFWYPGSNKLYLCDRSYSGNIKVFDCNTGTVVQTLELPCAYAGALNQASERLLLGDTNGIVVLDCRYDQVVDRLPGSFSPRFSAVDMIDNRIFFAARSNWLAVYQDYLGIAEKGTGQGQFRFQITNNPVRGTAHFICQIPVGKKATFSLHDVLGRVVSRKQILGAEGLMPLQWDGTDIQGRRVAAGIYFASLKSGTQQAIVKVVLE